MKTRKVQTVFIAIILSMAILVPTNTQAEQHKRTKRNAVQQVSYHSAPSTPGNATHKDRRYGTYCTAKPAVVVKVHQPVYKQHAHHMHTFYPTHPRQGYQTVFSCLPPQTHVMVLNGHAYYHSNKRFYKALPSGGYVQVMPPKYVQVLPHGTVKVRYNGKKAYYHGGVYFYRTPYGFMLL